MDADGLPLVGPGVDYTKVEAIHQKRTIAFINHFITHTASFLNRFSGVCEQKLEQLSNRIQHLEISMSLLEAKLSSVPGLENVTVAASSSTTTTVTDSSATPTTTTAAPASSATAAPAPSTVPGDPGAAAAAAPEEAKPTMTVSQHPSYTRFFKMVQVGVPAMAVKNKMIAEGLNPDLLDNPDAPAPDGGGSSSGGGGGGGNKSDSDDFSDDNDNGDDDEDDGGGDSDDEDW
ncbi:WASH complex subunit 3-like [Haliotis cracherodii]|uniref:WASH complex subunit 3-like n=1 Tax=Haliotis cracherodii TaxID=6455 RepID=UPI0039ED619F